MRFPGGPSPFATRALHLQVMMKRSWPGFFQRSQSKTSSSSSKSSSSPPSQSITFSSSDDADASITCLSAVVGPDGGIRNFSKSDVSHSHISKPKHPSKSSRSRSFCQRCPSVVHPLGVHRRDLRARSDQLGTSKPWARTGWISRGLGFRVLGFRVLGFSGALGSQHQRHQPGSIWLVYGLFGRRRQAQEYLQPLQIPVVDAAMDCTGSFDGSTFCQQIANLGPRYLRFSPARTNPCLFLKVARPPSVLVWTAT